MGALWYMQSIEVGSSSVVIDELRPTGFTAQSPALLIQPLKHKTVHKETVDEYNELEQAGRHGDVKSGKQAYTIPQ
jgi:serine acetyltransferase